MNWLHVGWFAALFEAPFAYAETHVQPTRVGKREKRTNERWWIFQWSRPLMRRAIAGLPRFIVTSEVAKHRVFAFLSRAIAPDKNLTVTARSDDTTFGILNSRFHELWSLRMGTSLEDRPRYTPTTTFETFPFPAGLTPADTGGPTETLDSGVVLPPVKTERRAAALAIADPAHGLNALRENWLNSPGVGGAGARGGPRLPGSDTPQARARRRPQGPYPHQPLQPASRLAGARAPCPRCGGGRRLRLGRLGIRSQTVDLSAALQNALKREQSTGLLVMSVEKNSPASKGGLIVGDILVAIAGNPVLHHDELFVRLNGAVAGKAAPVEILRGGQPQTLDIVIGERT